MAFYSPTPARMEFGLCLHRRSSVLAVPARSVPGQHLGKRFDLPCQFTPLTPRTLERATSTPPTVSTCELPSSFTPLTVPWMRDVAANLFPDASMPFTPKLYVPAGRALLLSSFPSHVTL